MVRLTRPITDLCGHKAIIFDAQGNVVGRKKLKYSEEVFTFEKASYIFSPLKSSHLKIISWFITTKYYFYVIGRPEPLVIKLGDTISPVIVSAQEFGVLINTKVLTELNALSKESLLAKLLTPLNIIIAVVIIGVLLWMQSTGKFG